MIFNPKKQFNTDKKILLIDDNEGDLYFIQSWLEKNGFNVFKTNNPEEGINLAKEHKPDIIFSDYTMPKMTGAEICKALASDPETSQIPVVILTGLDSPSSIIASFEQGAQDYVTKPFHMAKIGRQLKIILKDYNLL